MFIMTTVSQQVYGCTMHNIVLLKPCAIYCNNRHGGNQLCTGLALYAAFVSLGFIPNVLLDTPLTSLFSVSGVGFCIRKIGVNL